MLRASRVLFMFSAALLSIAQYATAQTTFATITGAVTDPSGSVVPNVTVTATNIQTGVKTTAQSNSAGNYTIPQLIEGRYKVEADAPGFRPFVAEDVIVASRDVRRVDIKLEVGAVQTAVQVKGGATLIETEISRISDTKDSLVLNTLPLNTRGIWAYLALSPGVQQQPGSSVVRFGGSRANQENWSIDGTTFSDGVDNTQTGPLGNYIESFQEVKVDLANNSAEFSSIGQVTLISKSGTNGARSITTLRPGSALAIRSARNAPPASGINPALRFPVPWRSRKSTMAAIGLFSFTLMKPRAAATRRNF